MLALKGRNGRAVYFAPSGLNDSFMFTHQGRCPWLFHRAPSGLHTKPFLNACEYVGLLSEFALARVARLLQDLHGRFRDVADDAQVREEVEVLEDHADAASELFDAALVLLLCETGFEPHVVALDRALRHPL